MENFYKLLSGGDLRSIGKSNSIVLKVQDQKYFDELFKCLFHKDRLVVMRAADAIEKITVQHPAYLSKYKNVILELCNAAKNKELKWHLALLIPRLNLSGKEIETVWQILSGWVSDKKESKIVRVSSIQALYEITLKCQRFTKAFRMLLAELEKENIPSINARLKRLTFNNHMF